MIRLLALLIFCGTAVAALASPVRIKDIVEFDGVRSNDLVGYGLVVGLNGTGDGIRNAPFTEEIMSNILERLGVNVTGEQFRPKNVAAVFVTAELPPFARTGSTIDITVSAIGDAKSLLGGTLVMTPLNAADGQIYAVAQGTVIAGGASVEGEGASVVQGVPTAGTIPSGARVEREIEFDFATLETVRLALRTPDFTTAGRIEAAINAAHGGVVARMLDPGTVVIDIRATGAPSPAHAMGRIENITVEPQSRARVVVDQRSGTIVLGEDVRISRVAVSQGNLTLRIEEAPLVVQPNPFAEGETVVVPRTSASIEEEPGIGLAEISGGTSLSEVIAGLNALGVSPRDMIDILKSIKAAGALHAEFIVR
ncbi:MAG: flagellar basal body P-ring protein FlgI [Rhodobacteraceae bacterium]|nr:flagellar basal body P-ring protein FlgI [Paracoccaceae bacterium]